MTTLSARQEAKEILRHYLQLPFKWNKQDWTDENAAEIDLLVDHLIQAAVGAVEEELTPTANARPLALPLAAPPIAKPLPLTLQLQALREDIEDVDQYADVGSRLRQLPEQLEVMLETLSALTEKVEVFVLTDRDPETALDDIEQALQKARVVLQGWER